MDQKMFFKLVLGESQLAEGKPVYKHGLGVE